MDHWYMMVVSMPHKTVYHLDTYLSSEEIPKRHQVMSQVVQSAPHIFN